MKSQGRRCRFASELRSSGARGGGSCGGTIGGALGEPKVGTPILAALPGPETVMRDTARDSQSKGFTITV